MEKIWNSLKEGLKNFCKENGFTDVAFGLSGGLDSAIVSVLAADALGAEHVHTLMMKTKYTAELSLNIAHKLADLNGFDYRVLDIQPIVDSQYEFLEKVFGEKPKQIVMENLQARERGKILMALSNQFGYLILACGNKSESSTGYCTLYGDTCGGLAPIGDLYKTTIFELAKWRNTLSYAIPEEVISRAPSAELSDGQKDEDSLHPYSVLDKILRAYLDNAKSKTEIIEQGFDEKTVDWVINQYKKTAFKRAQTPKALVVDEERDREK